MASCISLTHPQLQLIDFGATREYSVEFMDKWYRLLKSVIDNDREAMEEYSLKVGYLTGEENEVGVPIFHENPADFY